MDSRHIGLSENGVYPTMSVLMRNMVDFISGFGGTLFYRLGVALGQPSHLHIPLVAAI